MADKLLETVSLILPVYNEKSLVEPAITRCVEALERDFSGFEIIVIDDGSSDATGELLDQLVQVIPHIKVLHNLVNLNVGISVQRALVSATREFVVHNAVDLPLAPEDIAPLIRHMHDCDVLVLERKAYPGYTLWRKITSQINRFLLKLFFPITTKNIVDMNFTQIYRRAILDQIMPLAKSPAFTTPEMIIRAKVCGLRVKSILVEYKPRPSGKGAFGKPHDILWSLYDMLRFRLKSFRKQNVRKY